MKKNSRILVAVALTAGLIGSSTSAFATPASDYKAAVVVYKAALAKWQSDAVAARSAHAALVTDY